MKRLDQMDDNERKALPVYDGLLSYFPNALCLVAANSMEGQQQHAPDEPLQWHKYKSRDELGSLSRHLLDYAIAEARGDYSTMAEATASIAWRALAHAERFIGTTDEDPERYQKVKRLREALDE